MKAPRLTEQAVEHQAKSHRHRAEKQEENKQGRHGTIGNLLQSTL
jgi:hypothetical protein